MAVPPLGGGALGGALSVGEIFLYQLLGQILGAVMAPLTTELQQVSYSHFPDVPLSPAELADAVIKGHIPLSKAIEQAGLSGIDEERFRLSVDSGGEPPGLDFLLEAFRRGFIPRAGTGAGSVSLEQGIRESRLKDKWISVVENMGIRPIGVADAVDAVVESQIPHDQGQQIAYHNGISGDDFTILVHTRGQPPSPTEVIEMVRRGKIPLRGTGPDETSLQQAIYEGATKNKWEPIFEELTVAVPPPRTVVALIRAGTVSDQDGARYLQDAGLSPALAAAYVAEAHHTKNAAHRNLTVASILDFYEQRMVSADDATLLLGDLGYTVEESHELESYRDLQREIKAVNAAVDRIGKLYIGHKIDATSARNDLNQLRIPDAQVTELLSVWDVARAAEVKTLSEAQIVTAFHHAIIDQQTAQDWLVRTGYSAYEAWVLLSNREGGPLPNPPAIGP